MSEDLKKKAPKKRRLTLFVILFWVVICSGTGTLIGLMYAISENHLGTLPTFAELENPKSVYLASEIFSVDGKILGKYYTQNRSPVPYKDISPYLIEALIATEDARYLSHSGIDLRGLARAVIFMGSKGGASTITQQLAKNLFHKKAKTTPERIIQKLKEWVIAARLERNYTKEEIITMYLNTVEFTGNAFGIKAAAKTFFAKHPSQLKIEEAAVLIGMLKATTRFNPYKNPDKSKRRRNVVMNQMVNFGPLSEETYDSLKTLDLTLFYHVEDHNAGLAPYFREKLRETMKVWCKTHLKEDGEPYNLYKDGLKIYTTIDSRMQKHAEDAVREHLTLWQDKFYDHWDGSSNPPYGKNLTKKETERIVRNGMRKSERYRHLRYDNKFSKDTIEQIFNTPIKMKLFSWHGEIDTIMTPLDSVKFCKQLLHTGFMSMEVGTGHIKAWVGGIDHHHYQYDHVMKGKRQVGSTFKPFVYTVAVDNGYSPCFKVPDRAYTFVDDLGNKWTPKNSDGKYTEAMHSLKYGLAGSINSITAYVMKQFGPQPVVNIARKMGITSHIEAYPSICLGTFDLSVYEMVGAYGTFANKGIWVQPTYMIRIEDKNGNIIEEFNPLQREAISEQTAYGMVQMMKGVVNGVRHPTLINERTNRLKVEGTGRSLRFRHKFQGEICGKTGTTQNQSDGWFMGYTPEIVNGIWVGCEDRSAHFRSIELGQGAKMALPIWAYYMKKVYADSSLTYSYSSVFEKPLEAITINLDCEDEETDKKVDVSDNPFDAFD